MDVIHRFQPALRCLLLGLVLPTGAVVAEPPTVPAPTPTPAPPGSLAAYAAGRPLRVGPGAARGGALVVSNQNLHELAGDAGLTMAAAATGASGAAAAPTPGDPTVRQRWRKRYAAQRAAIRRLEDRRAALEEQLRQLRRGRVDARTLAREERLRAQIEGVDEQLRRGRDALAALVRDARREGAQPGWFHGL